LPPNYAQGEWCLTREGGGYMFLRKNEIETGNAGGYRHGVRAGMFTSKRREGAGMKRFRQIRLGILHTAPCSWDQQREKGDPQKHG